jgi:uncharacterized protein involved in exopolysaccharide biosynthesis
MEHKTTPVTPTSPLSWDPLREILATLWGARRLFLGGSFLVAVLVLLVSLLLLPRYYRSTATILPELDKNKFASMGQLQGLANLAGLTTGTTDLSRLYPAIAGSDAVLRSVILRRYRTSSTSDSVDLIRYFKLDEGSAEKDLHEALKTLRDLMGVSNDAKTNIVSLWVEMREPQLAADVLNSVIGHVDAFMRLKRTTSASEQAKWIGERLSQVEPELKAAEEALKDFREKNRRVSDSPELLLRQERLIREITVKSTITVELKKQWELARIEEIRNVPIVNVLDAGIAPVKKERPHYGINTIVALLTAMVLLGAYVLRGREYVEKMWSLWRSVVSYRSGERT